MKPAWSWQFDSEHLGQILDMGLPSPITRDWAWGASGGAGVRVAVVDSGIEAEHPAVERVTRAVSIEDAPGSADGIRVLEGAHEDLFGHGTACAGIIRRIAPHVELFSVRVLGPKLTGKGHVLFSRGLRWAIDNGMNVVNLSLSSRSRDYFAAFHELADAAYFRRSMLVCAINNEPAPSYPSEFASVFSTAAHEGVDPFLFDCNPTPPVEFGAPGIGIEVAWKGGSTVKVTGNSFAAAHLSGIIALILGEHPGLTPSQVKAILFALANNVAKPD